MSNAGPGRTKAPRCQCSAVAVAGARDRPARMRQAVVPEDASGVARAVNHLAWPVLLENLFQSGMATVDMIMVGRLGPDAIAGVGTAAQVIWVMQAAITAITTGTTVLVARSFGAGEHEQADRVVKQSLLLGLLVSALFALAGLFLSHLLIAALGADADVTYLGGTYLQIVAANGIVMVMMLVVSGALRGAGDTRTPMAVTGSINIINIIAAYVLIFGKLGLPPMGVAGAAWGATFARAVGTLVLLGSMLRKRAVLSIRGWGGWRPELALTRRLLRLGLPSMLEQLLLSGGALLYGAIAIGLGTATYATQRITFQAINYSFMPGMAFAMSATAMMGQCLGARRRDLGEKASAYATRMAIIWMTLMATVMAVFGRSMMRLFTDDLEIIEMGARALIVLAFSQPFQAIGQVLAGSLRGAGDTRFPMIATFIGIWFVRVPLGYLFGPVLGWGLSGIYIANVLDGIVRAAANYWRYRSRRWHSIRV